MVAPTQCPSSQLLVSAPPPTPAVPTQKPLALCPPPRPASPRRNKYIRQRAAAPPVEQAVLDPPAVFLLPSILAHLRLQDLLPGLPLQTHLEEQLASRASVPAPRAMWACPLASSREGTVRPVGYIDRPTRPAEACLDRYEQIRAQEASCGAGGILPPATTMPGAISARSGEAAVDIYTPSDKLPPKDRRAGDG